MREFDKATAWNDVRMNLFGVNSFKGVVPEGTSTLHFMLWKFTLIALTRSGLYGEPIDSTHIIDSAMRRLRNKIKALGHTIILDKNRSESRGLTLDIRKYTRKLEGIATVTPSGYVVPEKPLADLFELL